MDSFLPDSIFGLPMPWAHSHQMPTIDEDHSNEVVDPHSEHSPLDPTPTTIANTTSPIPVSSTLEHGVMLLKAEQCSRLKEKAQGLHAKVKALQEKIANIDTLLGLLSQYSQQNPDGTKNKSGTVDCTIPAIAQVVATLRKDNINVPLPKEHLEKGERGHVVNVLSNQRSLLGDEQREYAQEFQQCAVEQNSLFQALMSLASELNRVKLKMIDSFSAKASH